MPSKEKLKNQAFNQWILPVIIYDWETLVPYVKNLGNFQ